MPRARIALSLLVLCSCLPTAPHAERLRPPDVVTCPRDRLTSFTGRVVSYRRIPGQVSLRIDTDWGTSEAVRLSLGEGAGAARYFLLEGRLFREADWPAIEAAPGRLREPMRATAWVCDDGSVPIVDWQPSSEEGPDKPTR